MNTVMNHERLLTAWQTLKAVAHIESKTCYEEATVFLNSLLDIVRDDTKHPLYLPVAVVSDLIEADEIDQEPLVNFESCPES
jgi:hypothetical protein